ncbi:unnamed protein product [Durusdinium trenchii]|uniref:Uncharacterized protein n=1 Tax=Durusdinium trenchii TaxID=1381693 RepID=A0ABP0MVS8_9DINO
MEFDLLSHVSYNFQLAAQVVDAVPSSQVPLVIELPQADWPRAALVPLVSGAVASYWGFQNATAPELDNQQLAQEVLKMAYRSASWWDIAQKAYEPKPSDLKMTIQSFLQQARVLRPQQLAAELQARGCERVEDLTALLERDPDLWARIRMHSGHQKRLLQDLQFSIDGLWQQHSLVPAPIACKSMLGLVQKQKSSCFLQPTASIVLADRRVRQVCKLQAETRVLSFDILRSRIVNTKVEQCPRESLGHLSHRVMRNLCDTEDCLWKVTLLDQAMKPYHLVVLAGQLLWGLTDKGYSWLRTGLSHGACEFPSLCVGDMLLHFRKHPCVVVEMIPLPSKICSDRFVQLHLKGAPTIFVDGFLALASLV